MSTIKVLVCAAALILAFVAPGCGGGGPSGGSGGSGGGTGGVIGATRTLTFPAGVMGASPRFSRDGALLAYVRQDGSAYQVAVMTPTGADSRTLATDGDYLTAMTWSLDGAEVIYAGDNGIRAVPVAGGNGRLVVNAFAAVDPDLSSDGNWLVYGQNGGNLRLTDLRPTPAMENDLGVPGSSPRFSPDGSTIAFWGNGKISLMNVATKAVTDVLTTDNPFGRVDWFSDGERLLAGTDHGIEIVVLGATIGRTPLKDVFAVMDVDLSPDDRSVAYGVNGAAELYVLTGF